MIYTVTVNPAIDYVIHADNIILGQVNRTQGEEIYFGGKGINVSVVLNNLGIKSTALGFIAGFTGEAIENGVSALGIKTDFTKLQNGITRINVKIKSAQETDINGQGPDISDDEIDQLFAKIDKIQDGDILILAGSIPNTLPEDLYERILEKVCNKKIYFVVDATKDLLVNTLKFKPFLVKPNNFELGEIFGKTLTSDDDIVFYAKKLQELGAKNVLVSLAAKGAILITETGECFKTGTPQGKVKNSVGAGDSMVAGFIAGYLEKGDYGYALKFGTAAGSATAFSEGLGSKDLIMQLLSTL